MDKNKVTASQIRVHKSPVSLDKSYFNRTQWKDKIGIKYDKNIQVAITNLDGLRGFYKKIKVTNSKDRSIFEAQRSDLVTYADLKAHFYIQNRTIYEARALGFVAEKEEKGTLLITILGENPTHDIIDRLVRGLKENGYIDKDCKLENEKVKTGYEIYFFDVKLDYMVSENELTTLDQLFLAEIYVKLPTGEVKGKFRGSSYADFTAQIPQKAGKKASRKIIDEGTYSFVNSYGQGWKGEYMGKTTPDNRIKALNITQFKTDNRYNLPAQETVYYDSEKGKVVGTKSSAGLVNIHPSFAASDKEVGENVPVVKGWWGSDACLTIHPHDVDSFFALFDWTGEDMGNYKGTSSGTLFLYREDRSNRERLNQFKNQNGFANPVANAPLALTNQAIMYVTQDVFPINIHSSTTRKLHPDFNPTLDKILLDLKNNPHKILVIRGLIDNKWKSFGVTLPENLITEADTFFKNGGINNDRIIIERKNMEENYHIDMKNPEIELEIRKPK